MSEGERERGMTEEEIVALREFVRTGCHEVLLPEPINTELVEKFLSTLDQTRSELEAARRERDEAKAEWKGILTDLDNAATRNAMWKDRAEKAEALLRSAGDVVESANAAHARALAAESSLASAEREIGEIRTTIRSIDNGMWKSGALWQMTEADHGRLSALLTPSPGGKGKP